MTKSDREIKKRYTRVVKFIGGHGKQEYHIRFFADGQEFSIDYKPPNKKAANWMQNMLAIAINKIVLKEKP